MQIRGARVGVTGVGGFIGAALAARARKLGATVRGLERDPTAARRVEAQGVEVVVGDITDPEAARRFSAGLDVVVHTAAVVDEDGPLSLFRAVNVGGTETVARAARDAGARRFVQLSSVMVYGFRYPRLVDEEGPLRGEGNPYCETKIESEARALAMHAPGRFEVTVVRPGDVYGPGSRPWVLRPIELMRKRLFALMDGGRGTMNHVHVDNLLDGIVLLVERDAVGRAYNVTDGAETTFADYFGRLAAIVGRRSLPSLPSSVARAAFGVIARGARLVGKAAPAQPAAVDFVTRPYPYSIARITREVGYAPRVSLDDGMAELGRLYAAAARPAA
jgi:nucleoside-diphosphate-sugar epimerase